MKRLHVHVSIKGLDASIRFDSQLSASEPVVRKHDYAKRMLDDPWVNFDHQPAGRRAPGVQHLGIQVEDCRELAKVYAPLQRADRPVIERCVGLGSAVCA